MDSLNASLIVRGIGPALKGHDFSRATKASTSHAASAAEGRLVDFSDRLFAIVLCWSLALPAPLGMAQQAAVSTGAAASAGQPSPDSALPNPPRRQAYNSSQIQGDDRILHALNRFTFGPRPGDLEAVRKMGLDKWFDQQLHPGTIDEQDLNARLANYPAMGWTPELLMYRAPNGAVIRQAMNGKAPMPDQGTLRAVYENQIYRMQLKKEGLLGKKAQAGNTAPNAQSPAAAAGSMNTAPPAPSTNQSEAWTLPRPPAQTCPWRLRRRLRQTRTLAE